MPATGVSPIMVMVLRGDACFRVPLMYDACGSAVRAYPARISLIRACIIGSTRLKWEPSGTAFRLNHYGDRCSGNGQMENSFVHEEETGNEKAKRSRRSQ